MSRSVTEHLGMVRTMLEPLTAREPTVVTLENALGRVLTADVLSPIDLPVFRNSQMDGYAVAAASVVAVPVRLPVAGVLAAGVPRITELRPGSAVKIMTGAPVPSGADCVVPVEDTSSTDGQVTIIRGRVAGDFVRVAGADLHAGQPLALAGVLLAPRHIAALAAAGVTSVPVRPRVRTAVITTGDELVPPGNPLAPGQIYDSNGIALAAALRDCGATVVSVAHSADDAAAFRDLLAVATTQADVVLTSGGISMGDFEVVRESLAPLGGEFGHVAMQPGGPQGLSTVGGVPILSFPGNPVSTLVSFAVFARPILRELAGLPPIVAESLRLAAPVRSAAGKCQFLRGRRAEGAVVPLAGHGSHLIASMTQADVLIEIAPEVTELAAATDVRVLLL
jgi:molybdopterin molybdotransferase